MTGPSGCQKDFSKYETSVAHFPAIITPRFDDKRDGGFCVSSVPSMRRAPCGTVSSAAVYVACTLSVNKRGQLGNSVAGRNN